MPSVAANVRVVIAPNPGANTHQGTNTYLVTEPDGITVIDAGPEIAAHVEAVIAAAGGPIRRIVNTHTHHDHAGAARLLGQRTGAPIFGYVPVFRPQYAPDVPLADGERIGALTAIFTPGHCPDHLCLSLDDKVLFCGDTVLSWSSTMIVPPHGNLRDYLASLTRLGARPENLYLPGHGPAVDNPAEHIGVLLARRARREQSVLSALAGGRATLAQLVDRLYRVAGPELRRSGRDILHAHLLKLQEDGLTQSDGDYWWLAEGGGRG